ncbi:hypothetical protein B0H10DRAFT_387257 [Mycena sp. CBHHK59/15]|nr:hypothetical protein B0H10DRAFT_387257 [Mycena sp. CBHHK59/15]
MDPDDAALILEFSEPRDVLAGATLSAHGGAPLYAVSTDARGGTSTVRRVDADAGDSEGAPLAVITRRTAQIALRGRPPVRLGRWLKTGGLGALCVCYSYRACRSLIIFLANAIGQRASSRRASSTRGGRTTRGSFPCGRATRRSRGTHGARRRGSRCAMRRWACRTRWCSRASCSCSGGRARGREGRGRARCAAGCCAR